MEIISNKSSQLQTTICIKWNVCSSLSLISPICPPSISTCQKKNQLIEPDKLLELTPFASRASNNSSIINWLDNCWCFLKENYARTTLNTITKVKTNRRFNCIILSQSSHESTIGTQGIAATAQSLPFPFYD